jgi:hypothetical protein
MQEGKKLVDVHASETLGGVMKKLLVVLAFALCSTFTAQAGVVKSSAHLVKKSAHVTAKTTRNIWKALW